MPAHSARKATVSDLPSISRHKGHAPAAAPPHAKAPGGHAPAAATSSPAKGALGPKSALATGGKGGKGGKSVKHHPESRPLTNWDYTSEHAIAQEFLSKTHVVAI